MIVELTDGGVDFSFECIGNVNVMRAALECCHKGWGEHHHRRRRRRPGNQHASVPAGHGPRLARLRLWRRQGRTQLPGMVEDAMSGKIDLDPFVTHTLPLDRINEAFDLMHEGKSIRTVIHY